MCNPEVTLPEGKDRKLEAADEGCLSLPGAYAELARPDNALCRGQDAFGRPVELIGTGLLARCLQHETDHLNGTVFGDRLPGRARKKLYARHEELADQFPADWPVSPRLGGDGEDHPPPNDPSRLFLPCRRNGGLAPALRAAECRSVG